MAPRKSPVVLPDPTDIKRINVAVNPDLVRALQNVMAREHVNLTEATRRLIGYGDYMYRAVKEKGQEILLRDDDGTKEVILLR